MHCVIARVYPLYRPPSSCLLYSLELYSAEEIFCWMVPRYYLAAIYSFSLLSLYPFSLSLSLCFYSVHISYIRSPLCAPVILPGIYVNAIPVSRTPTTGTSRTR